MILKKRLTEKVWFDGALWTVAQVFQPTKHDDYLLLTRKSETTCHDDGTIPVEAILIDCHNDTFYPDTAEVRREMRAKAREDAARDSRRKRSDRMLTDSWLRMFRDQFRGER